MGAEGAAGVRTTAGGDRFGGSVHNQLASLMAALGAQIEDPIGAFEDVKMMLDHQAECPAATSRCRQSSRRWISARCRPVVGSSRM